MVVNTKTFLKAFQNLCLALVFILGIMTIVATGGGGGDGGTGTNPGGDTSGDTSDDNSGDTSGDTSETSYDSSDLPTGTSFVYEDDDSSPTTITFGSITITGDTASATNEGNVVTINSPGTFYITGAIADGQIKVDTPEDGDVRLVFQNAYISCSFGPPIDIENAERVVVRLEADTDNYLTDTHTSVVYDEDGEEIDAALYSKEDLVICGTGTLNIVTDYKDGIKTKDSLIIDSGNINITSEDDGIIGKNYISIEDGNINIVAGGDGLKSTEDDEADQGYIYITDGVFNIDAGADAIQVQTHIVIQNGEFDFYTANGSSSTTSDTAKGLKASIGITIYDGEFTIDSSDDSIHSNDTIVINGGEYLLYSGDDTIHADEAITVNGGIIDVLDCYEGIEGMVIKINDGEIHVESYDDPINATDGNRGENTPGVAIYINGGYTYLECVNADGFDSNGAVYLNGGTVVVNGPVSGGNGILDYGTFTSSGGTFIGAGTSDMAQAPGSSSSSQNALLVGFNRKSAGTLFHLETDDGTDVLTFAPKKAYGAIAYSSALLETGTSYKIYLGGTYTGGSVKDGVYQDGVYTSEGSAAATFTVTGSVMSGSI